MYRRTIQVAPASRRLSGGHPARRRHSCRNCKAASPVLAQQTPEPGLHCSTNARRLHYWCLMSTTGERFERAVTIMARLRGPDGCPWDREQTFDSIKPYTLEETYEVLDAIDRRDWPGLTEELGDFLLQAAFYAQMASEAGLFRMEDCLRAINEKLIRRHPHVFGTVDART